METLKVRTPAEGPFEIHTLAGLVPMAVEIEQLAIAESIRDGGQKLPIELWHGKVIDGRCRQKALVTLNYPIMYKELSDDLTEDEVAIYVKAVNIRRNLTTAQKAMSGAIDKVDGRDTRSNPVVAKSWAVGENTLKNAMYIYKYNKDMSRTLFDGLAVNIVDNKGRTTTSNKISAVYAHIRRLEEDVVTHEDNYTWDVKDMIKTQVGIDAYFEIVKQAKENGYGYSQEQCKTLAELLNYKYIKEDNYDGI